MTARDRVGVSAGRRTRIAASVCAVATLALGLALQVPTRSPLIDFVGGALYVMLAGFLVVVVAPRLRPPVVAALAFTIAAAVELAQLTPVPAAIVEAIPLARLVLGSAFDPLDLVAYAVGAAALAPIAARIARRDRDPSTAGASLRR